MRSLPAEVYSLVEGTPGTVLLEGCPQKSEFEEKLWTRLFTNPLRVCIAWHPAELPALFDEIERAVAAGLSAAGYFTYECGLAFEPKSAMRPPRADAPLAWFGIYDRPHIFDHNTGAFLDSPKLAGLAPPALRPATGFDAEFAVSEPEYTRRIATIHEWIRAGDVYQLNFTAPLRFHTEEGPAALYARLRASQPAHYGAFIHALQDRHILSLSPELFFRVDPSGLSRKITTRPMKGTAPRGRTTSEDRAVSDWLHNDAKNRSENLMIVDLLRNDLGRLARFGTVRAESLFAVERLSTLWQMTSTVTAEVRDDVCFKDLFQALFPSGSITGAPKVRAMQLIAKLEDQPRGVYTGAIGFFSPQQTVFNVAIRTIEFEHMQGMMGLGSGIVIDSDPAAEYRECLLKGEFLTRSTDQESFSLIETMLWTGTYPLLPMHLDRLTDSAEYFGFPCEPSVMESALRRYAQQFAENAPRRVRLLLSANGAIDISHQLLAEPPQSGSISRVLVASEQTDPKDPFLFHKTTRRRQYTAAFEAALREGYADVLFFNAQGELTEGAISNVFLEKDGRWFTPPIECGLLAGVYRRHLLETRPEIELCVLFEQDLRTADAIYIANAVRGLRKATIDWRNNR
jgi:para-aminobenzoate synthetase/4-amino-4-deoxychorismate lyase